MIIVGVDVSLQSSGLVKADLDDDLEIRQMAWLGFTTVKDVYKDNKENLHFYKQFPVYLDRSIWMRDTIINNLYNEFELPPMYIAIEDYAYQETSGRTFHIGGFTEILKLEIYLRHAKIRLYDITLIKKFATTRGTADKIAMYDAYMKIPLKERIDISTLPIVDNAKGKSPTSDIIDAYYIMKMLQLELKLRRGIVTLRELTEDQIWVFNRITKTSKENILTRDFLEKPNEPTDN